MLNLFKPFTGPVLGSVAQGAVQHFMEMNPYFAGAIWGFLAFWLILAIVSHKELVRRYPHIREWLPFVDPTGAIRANPKDLTGRHISDQSFNIVDLAPIGRIENRHFEDCDIFGPAILYMAGVGHTYECTLVIADSDPNSAFIGLDIGAKTIGAILVKDCTFRRCRFLGVGFIGTKEDKQKYLAGFTHQQAADIPDSKNQGVS